MPKCKICHRELTSPESVAKGIGPECEGRRGRHVRRHGRAIHPQDTLKGYESPAPVTMITDSEASPAVWPVMRGEMKMENIWIPELVPLDQVDANPWQVRDEDTEHVMDVARSIAEHNLIQSGTGRRVDGRVQLAIAHTRLAAFRYLDEQFGVRGNGQAGDKFAAFPVVIRELSDEQMAAFAIEENFKRKDLTTIEKARALKRYMADFGKTQAEAGERFNLTQSAVSHLITLLDNLPEELQALVAQRRLAERHARVLVSVAKLSVENAVRIGKLIGEADPAESDQVASEALAEFCESEGRGMEGAYWPPDWKPEVFLNGEQLPACRGCPAFFTGKFNGDDYCLRPECMEAKIQAWEAKELSRLSEKFGIPIADIGDLCFNPLNWDYEHETAARNMLKRKIKPECLRLVANRGQKNVSSYKHQHLLDSKVVLLASSDPHVLDPKEKAPAPAPGATDEEVTAAAERARQTEKEREEREAEVRRSERAAIRRAQADMTWLVFNTAEMLAPQITILPGGLLLELLKCHRLHTHNPAYEWPEFRERYEALEDLADSGKEPRSPLIGYQVMIARELGARMSGYNAKRQFDWPEALEHVTKLAREWGLKLVKGWNEPPIHKTPANCHTCGRFASMNHVTARDGEDGWRVDGEVVTCSEECRVGSTKDTKIAKVAKGKVAGRKSQAVKKSQTGRKAKK